MRGLKQFSTLSKRTHHADRPSSPGRSEIATAAQDLALPIAPPLSLYPNLGDTLWQPPYEAPSSDDMRRRTRGSTT